MDNHGDPSEPPTSLTVPPDECEDTVCWKCDDPDATEADYFTMIQGVIDSHGWYVRGVEKDRWRPGFAYRDDPPSRGAPPQRPRPPAGRHGAPAFVAGERHVWPGGDAIEVVDVAEPTVHLVMAREMFGPDVRAVELVYADDRGRWPREVGFRGDQPVLGPRAETWADQ